MLMASKPSVEDLLTSALAPDLERVGRFITDMIGKGAVAALVTAILGLLSRMRDLNLELMRRLTVARRKQPANEEFRRLQMELPFLVPAESGAARGGKDSTEEGKGNKGNTGNKGNKRGPKNRDAHGRPKFPPHIPRVPDVRPVPDAERTCPHCGGEAKHIGYKTCSKLDIEPARYVVREEKREVVACQDCHGYVATTPKRDEVLDRGILGNSLLVHAIVDHYQDAMPWERMARRAHQEGVPLAANTLAASCGRVIDLLDPIVRHIFTRCVASEYFAFDATLLPVLDAEHPLGIRSGTLWLLQGAHCYSYFMYAESGHAHHLEAKLKGFKLVSAMCDGSATNNCVERAGATRGGCNAHARRKLVEALRGGDQRALEALEIFAQIFHVDAESKRAGESVEQRLARRLRESAPLMAQMRVWIETRLGDTEPKSTLGRAVRYMHKQWRRLSEFLRTAIMELTNNEVERDLRTWVLDRKTWFFCGHDQSARRTADALTIITTCKKLGIDPRRYIRDTLERILNGEKDLGCLLPENYKPHRVAAAPIGAAQQTAA